MTLATGTKLDRDVAIKLFPEQFAGDPERPARFQREPEDQKAQSQVIFH
jgi:hypothetical protein